jgi:hypothetical protein
MEAYDLDLIHQKLLHTCAWCNQVIPADTEIFGFGAKASPGVDLSTNEGKFVSLQMALIDKTVVALVPAEDSAPREQGFNLVFITCSQICAEELKEALQFEKDVLK